MQSVYVITSSIVVQYSIYIYIVPSCTVYVVSYPLQIRILPLLASRTLDVATAAAARHYHRHCQKATPLPSNGVHRISLISVYSLAQPGLSRWSIDVCFRILTASPQKSKESYSVIRTSPCLFWFSCCSCCGSMRPTPSSTLLA